MLTLWCMLSKVLKAYVYLQSFLTQPKAMCNAI